MNHLLQPLHLGSLLLPNRIIMAPLTRCRATSDHLATSLMAEHYAQRASAGLIIAEA
ncbi:MAG: alkene reductase, partial [Desulfobulbus sp.]|nr:alkene reductase [Desulfobulbus sp.]